MQFKTFTTKEPIGVVRRFTIQDHDPGDESDYEFIPLWQRYRIVAGKTVVVWPRRYLSERVPTRPNHDGGDEDEEWRPRENPLGILSENVTFDEVD